MILTGMKGRRWLDIYQEGLRAEVIIILEVTQYELTKLCKGSGEHRVETKKSKDRTAWCGIKHCSDS